MDGKGGREKLGGVEEGETIIRMHCVRGENLLSTKGKKKCDQKATWGLFGLFFWVIVHHSCPLCSIFGFEPFLSWLSRLSSPTHVNYQSRKYTTS